MYVFDAGCIVNINFQNNNKFNYIRQIRSIRSIRKHS